MQCTNTILLSKVRNIALSEAASLNTIAVVANEKECFSTYTDYYNLCGCSQLKESSKKAIRTAIEPLRREYGHLPIIGLERRHVKGLLVKQFGSGSADKLL